MVSTKPASSRGRIVSLSALIAHPATRRHALLHDGIHAEAARCLTRRILQEGFEEIPFDQRSTASPSMSSNSPL
jgi:hypothetical protein